ncbi:MAG: porin family protein [Bacteroidaceae bacterium]|nr:porin family protein [Bacteroidaceae bacterium]
MKKLFGIIMVAVAMFMATPANAQFKFGVKAGLNVSKVSFDKDIAKNAIDSRTGFFVGPMAEFTVPIIGLGADVAVLYDNKGVEVDGVSETLQYIDIPINVKYSIGLGSIVGVYVATGPQFSYNIGGKKIFENLENSYSLKSSEFSWNVGAGVKLLGHLQVGYNYNIGIGKTGEIDNAVDAAGKILKNDVKNNTHQISVAYLF